MSFFVSGSTGTKQPCLLQSSLVVEITRMFNQEPTRDYSEFLTDFPDNSVTTSALKTNHR